MSIKKQYLTYRGAITALHRSHTELILGTAHEEGLATGVYFIDPLKATMRHAELPGVRALLSDEQGFVFAACEDGRLYRGSIKRGELEPIGEAFEPPAVAMAPLANEQLAVAHGAQVTIASRLDGSVHQRLELEEPVSALASDASGQWLVVGGERGAMTVFERETGPRFVLSGAVRAHERAITALLFESEELRVLSTGRDNRLLVTHARGELEPQDRGGKGMHEKEALALLQGPSSRFYSAGLDGAIKAWPAGRTNQRPVTQKDDVVRTSHLCLYGQGESMTLVAAGLDQSVRFYALDEEGKVGEAKLMLFGALAWAKRQLEESDPSKRREALEALGRFDDEEALALLDARVTEERDHTLQGVAAEQLAASSHPQARQALIGHLRSPSAEVRSICFEGLRRQDGAGSLKPLELALQTGHKDLGALAIEALGELAKGGDDRALEMLIEALGQADQETRYAAYAQLERHYGVKSAESALLVLQRTRHEDLRATATVRFWQLGLLDQPRVEATVRRLLEDDQAEVRCYAFLTSLQRSKALVEVLRSRDEDLHRQLFVIEAPGLSEAEREKGAVPIKAPKSAEKLAEADLEPLFEALAARALDTCLRGALGLAALQDGRVFGALLQLSRKTPEARIQTARAFEKLGDLRSVKRLRMMIRDASVPVRDAAYGALIALESEAPLVAAQAGLSAAHEDVRLRGLQVLARELRKKQVEARAFELLDRALNDPLAAVRNEALKVSLNEKVFASSEEALQHANASVHADVRHKVLIELIAQSQEDWAWNMLLEALNDPDRALRTEAFEAASKRARKARRAQTLSSALQSRHTDVRLLAVEELTRRRLEDVEALMSEALKDRDAQVRAKAIDALVRARAEAMLVEAMSSPFVDVSVKAARARAHAGDARALKPLERLVRLKPPEPDRAQEGTELSQKVWLKTVVEALQGLEELGDPSAIEAITPLIESEHAEIRQHAVRALVWSSRRDALHQLREVVRHQDAAVKREAALGLAYWGDAFGAAMIFADSKEDVNAQILAGLGLLEEDEDYLLALLDHRDARVRSRVLALLLLLELGERDGVPDKCLAAISSEHADVRLKAAGALEAFTQRERFEAIALELLRSRGLTNNAAASTQIDLEGMRQLSRALTGGSTPVKIRAARLLQVLFERSDEEFELSWQTYTSRHAAALEALAQRAQQALTQSARDDGGSEPPRGESGLMARGWSGLKRAVKRATGKAPEGSSYEMAIRRLAFGALVGLSREPGSDATRAGAISQMVSLSQRHEEFAHETGRVLLVALGDSNQEVRLLALRELLALKMPVRLVATEALATGHAEMGRQGLTLLAEQVSPKEAEQLLEEAMLTKSDGLEHEALALVRARKGDLFALQRALAARSSSLRRDVLHELISEAQGRDEALRALGTVALASRFEDVRYGAAHALVHRRDLDQTTQERLFSVLLERLEEPELSDQSAAARDLIELDAERGAVALLDRIGGDKTQPVNVEVLFAQVGASRAEGVKTRLFAQIERDTHRREAFETLFKISGYDQFNADPQDERAFERESWLATQHPRRDPILAELLDWAYRLNDMSWMRRLIPHARWALGSELDRALRPLVSVSHEEVRREAIEAIGWRARHRSGPVEPLKAALADASPEVQLLAAEGLALAGERDGLSVLMAAVNFMEDYGLRRRAVLALGALAEAQSLDLLLSLVQDESSFLRPAAAEALGYMSAHERAPQILAQLTVFAKSDDADLSQSALTGLAHFDTVEAWRAIRAEALEPSPWWRREKVARLLGMKNDPAHLELLRQQLFSDEDRDVVYAASESLRELYGANSLEPDYLFVLLPGAERYHFVEQSVTRLCERGEVNRLLEIIPKLQVIAHGPDPIAAPLINALLSRTPLPVDEMADHLIDEDVRTALLATRILGRAELSTARRYSDRVVEALAKTRVEWHEAQAAWRKDARRHAARFEGLTARYAALAWVAGRLEVGLEEVLAALDLPGGVEAKRLHREALLAIAKPWSGERGVQRLRELLSDDHAALRELAAEALQELNAPIDEGTLRASIQDAVVFHRLVDEAPPAQAQSVMRQSARNVHVQGVVIGHLAERGDEQGLRVLLQDATLSEEVRLGAVDALAQIASEGAIEALAALGKSSDEDEALRKAAWRARRRAVRIQKQHQQQQQQQEVPS